MYEHYIVQTVCLSLHAHCTLYTQEPEPVLKTAHAKLMACPEDEDFLSAFEKMMTDEIQTSRTDATKVPIMDVAIPMNLKGPKVKQRPLGMLI